MNNHSSKFWYQQAVPTKGNIKVDSSCQHNKEQTNVNESAEPKLKPTSFSQNQSPAQFKYIASALDLLIKDIQKNFKLWPSSFWDVAKAGTEEKK